MADTKPDPSEDVNPGTRPPDPAPRVVSAEVALVILEVIRSQDRPDEVLQDEDPAITMPRRLGLSGVIDTQIRRYRSEVKRREKLRESEIADLFGLVVRRPDATEVFFEAGALLAGPLPRRRKEGKLDSRIGSALARRRIRRRLRTLFGVSITGAGTDSFRLHGTGLLFARTTPRGQACEIVTGLGQAVLEGYDRRPLLLVHDECEARGGDRCGWTLSFGQEGDEPQRAEANGPTRLRWTL